MFYFEYCNLVAFYQIEFVVVKNTRCLLVIAHGSYAFTIPFQVSLIVNPPLYAGLASLTASLASARTKETQVPGVCVTTLSSMLDVRFV